MIQLRMFHHLTVLHVCFDDRLTVSCQKNFPVTNALSMASVHIWSFVATTVASSCWTFMPQANDRIYDPEPTHRPPVSYINWV